MHLTLRERLLTSVTWKPHHFTPTLLLSCEQRTRSYPTEFVLKPSVTENIYKRLSGIHTILSHANLHTLLQPTVLAVVSVLNIHRAIPVSSARVRKVASNASFKKTLTPFASKNTVMFSRWFIAANDAFDGRFRRSWTVFALGAVFWRIKRIFEKNRRIGVHVWKFRLRQSDGMGQGGYVDVNCWCWLIGKRVHNKLELGVKEAANWRGWPHLIQTSMTIVGPWRGIASWEQKQLVAFM